MELDGPVRVFLYPTPSSYFDQPLSQQSLFSPQDPYSISVFFPGNWEDYEKLLGTGLAALYIYHTYRELDVLQRVPITDVPFWFKTGLALYLGEGWSIHDEMLLSRYAPFANVKKLKDITPFTKESYLLAKSVWHYIVTKYRWQKAKEIFVLGKLSGSAATGLYSSIGISIAEFTRQWLDFLQTEYGDQSKQNLPAFKSYGLPFSEILSFAMSPNRKRVAFLTYENQHFNLYILPFPPPKKGEKRKAIFSYPLHIHPYFLRYLVTNTIWKDDKRLLVTFPEKKDYVTLVLDLEDDQIVQSQQIRWGQFDLIQDMTYSPQLKSFLFCGVSDGTMNLFSLDEQFRKLQPLWKKKETKEIRYPIYAGAYFWAEPDTDTLTQRRFWVIRRSFFLSDSATVFAQLAPTSTLFSLHGLDPYHLLLFQNVTGRPNLFLQDTQTIAQISRFDHFLFQVQLNQQNVYALSFFNKQYHLLDFPLDTTRSYFQPYSTFQEQVLRNYLALRSKMLRENEQIQAQKQEEKRRKKQPFFFFDDTPSPPEEKEKTAESVPSVSTSVARWKRVSNGLEKGSAQDLFVIDPLYRLGIGMEWQFHTPRNRSDLRLSYLTFQDLRSNSFQLDFDHRLNRFITAGLNLERHVRLWRAPDYLRFSWYAGNLHCNFYPSLNHRIGVEFLPSYFGRRDLKTYDNVRYDSAQVGFLARFHWQWDRVRYHFHSPYHGFWIRIQGERYQGIRYPRSFWRVQVQSKWYVPLLPGITWASQFQGGVIFGNYTPLFRLGGINQWMNYQLAGRNTLPLYEAPESMYLFSLAMPVRGFPYNSRYGTKYAILNTELRLAFGELFLGGLPYKNHQKFHWLLFSDIGTAWTTGNPFSQRNPIQVETIESYPITVTIRSVRYPFLISAGTGVCFDLAGVTMVPTLSLLFENAAFSSLNFLLHFEKPF
jgi:hypothetical protein